MFESLKQSLSQWQSRTNERVKLQHTYLAVAIGLLLVAGIIGLVNHNLGQNILAAAIVSATIFIINAVTWSLLQSAVLARSSRHTSTRKK